MRNIRISLFMTTFVLICIGVIMIYSASSIYALDRYNDSMYFLKRHLSFVFIGFIISFFLMSIDYKKLRNIARPTMILSIILLVLVLIIGKEVSGATRWFRLGFFSFQPSELASLGIIIYLADFIARKEQFMSTIQWGLLPPMVVLGTTSLLILMQPDLGTTVSICVVTFIMLYVGGVKFWYLLSLILSAFPPLYFLVFHVPYRRARIMAFLNPWADPKGSGFQIIQSQIALGSGGLWGAGLGQSKQKLFYLPAAHTDFIFSIIGEELGLVGSILVIFLFLYFIKICLKIIKNASDKFGYFLGLGLLSMICFKTIVNIGVSCGLFPTKGLPLPFISYGGSSFIFDMVAVGLLLNIAKQAES